MKKTMLILSLMLVLCSMAVLATTGTETPAYDYDEGNWTDPEKGADYDYTDYAQCGNGYGAACYLQVNFSFTGHNPSYMNSIIWGVNLSQIVNGVDVTDQPDCLVNLEPVRIMMFINDTADPNTTFYCEDRGAPSSWLWLDEGNYTQGNISGMYMYWTDTAPTVGIDLTLNGSTKECDDGVLETIDIVYEVNDTTDVEFDCCPYVNDAERTTWCNSSVQNATTSVFYDVTIDEGRNEIYVNCTDENGEAQSDTLEVTGEACGACNTNEFPGESLLVLGVISLLIAGLAGLKNKWFLFFLITVAAVFFFLYLISGC